MQSDTHYRILKLIAEDPAVSQRDLSRRLGISLGKTNYCLRALVEKGWVKAGNFRRSDDKMAYAYILTPSGVRQKTLLAVAFLRRKVAEFESLRREISELRADVEGSTDGDVT